MTFAQFTGLIETVGQWGTIVVSAAAAAAATLPDGPPGSLLWKIHKVIDVLAVNVGNAAKKTDRNKLQE